MGRIVFVDGRQGAGKSTLIRLAEKIGDISSLKFSFSEYSKFFDLQDNAQLKGFQLGKDLASVYFIDNLVDPDGQTVLVDRGPLSSAYYSISTGRMSLSEVDEFLRIVSTMSKNISFIFVVSKNQKGFVRLKGDGFDQLESDTGIDWKTDKLLELCNKHSLPVQVFENDFSVDLESNAKKFYKIIKEAL